jgi:hypothetical protein
MTTVLSILFLTYFLGHDTTYLPSFDYKDDATYAERDFALLASEFLQEDVDVVIGECKSLGEMEEGQRNAIRQLGQQTGAYLAFCTLSDGFNADDKVIFEGLVDAGQKPILLTAKHLEMSYMDIENYKHQKHWIGRDAELISRVTIAEVLGKEVADKHQLRVYDK